VWNNELNLVLTSEVGGPLDPANLRRVIRRVVARTGIDKRVVPYSLRSSSISILDDADVPMSRVANTAGNDPATAYRHYRYRLRKIHGDHIEPMTDVFGDGSEPAT
jgi:hypothetical protein